MEQLQAGIHIQCSNLGIIEEVSLLEFREVLHVHYQRREEKVEEDEEAEYEQYLVG